MNDVLAGRFTPALAGVVVSILDRAEHHLREARDLPRQVPRRAMPVLLTAILAGMYMRRLRRAGGNPFADGLTISPLRKQLRLTLAKSLGRY
jgi:phytoene/squalene synthetase